MNEDPSRQYLLYDAASRWNAPPLWHGPEEVIEAAVNCLVDGVDSPSLRLLAGASPNDPTEQIRELIEATLSELGLPAPGQMRCTESIGSSGQVMTRLPRDTVRFEVRSAEPDHWASELLVYINDVEMTRLGAGMGMDPFDVLIPENRLVATEVPSHVGIARCDCGEYGCGSTDVVIVRQGDVVHWDWEYEAPIRGGVSFKAAEYDAEVARIGSERSWEREEDTTARLVLTGVDRGRLTELGLRLDWATKDHADHAGFKVALYYGSTDWQSTEPGYQVFIRARREGKSPQAVADAVLAELAKEPREWRATWHATKPGPIRPPAIAGKHWKHEPIGLPPQKPQEKQPRRWWHR